MAVDPHKLDEAILEAHERQDGWTLAQLYFEASQMKKADGNEPACAFLLTQAYVFALECSHPLASVAHGELVKLGRDSL